jgi:ABC-type sugar transport system substrate-binding protein
MSTKAKIVFAAALILGTASAALAGGSDNDADSRLGGFVHPPSMDGVNPVYHPGWFPNVARAHRAADNAYAFSPSADDAYAFAPSATRKHRSAR